MSERLLNKEKTVKLLKAKGYDVAIEDSLIFVYYDETHDSKILPQIVAKEMENLNYGSSYGVKTRDKRDGSSKVKEEIEEAAV